MNSVPNCILTSALSILLLAGCASAPETKHQNSLEATRAYAERVCGGAEHIQDVSQDAFSCKPHR